MCISITVPIDVVVSFVLRGRWRAVVDRRVALLVRRQPFWRAVLDGVVVRLRDAADRLQVASRGLYASSISAVLVDRSERHQAIGHEVRESTLLPFRLVRLQFGSVSLSTMLSFKSDSRCVLAGCFRFSTSFRLCQLLVHEFCIAGVSLRFLSVSRFATPSWSASGGLKF